MRITDRVYGTTELEAPILIELINGPSLQRLKGIDQAGYFEPHFPGTAHSRFEHSVGVCLLLKRFGAPLEEQIAGLIHDVSHSAFSHCIDYVLAAGSQKEQNHQDNAFDAYVKASEIPSILERYGFDPLSLLDDSRFPLKERELPDLCADRIDYVLRGALVFGELSDADDMLDRLTVMDGRWVFEDEESARAFAELFRTMNTKYYSGIPSAAMFRTVGDYLRHALSQGYVTENDLYTDDATALAKIAPHHVADETLKRFFDRMNLKIGYRNDPDDFEAEVFCKSRAVDPLFVRDGNVVRLSGADPAWGEILREESKPKRYFLTFER